MNTEFDYIIVGAGSAGCALAARLSEDPGVSVCLVETGGTDKSVLIHAPAGVVAIMPRKGKLNYGYETVPQPGLNGRRGYQPRGRVLGGSSSINAMVYVRGNRWDYDHWAALGNRGWSYEEVLPYFIRSENNENFGAPFHGKGGPLNVMNQRSPGKLNEYFLQACGQHGIPRAEDYNGETQEGCFVCQVTHINGERCSAAKAYLKPNLNRPNLTVMTDTAAQRVLFEGKRAVGIRARQGRQSVDLTARREVVLSGGAFNSPQLLMLSGIGPGTHLQHNGIEVLNDLPGVGQNLQDHIDIVHGFKGPADSDTFGFSPGFMLRMTRAVFEWRNKRSGLLTTPYAEAGAFFRSSPEVEIPDLEFLFIRAPVDDHGRKMHLHHGFSCHTTLLRPRSKGEVTLAGADPATDPVINPRFLEDDEDMRIFKLGAKLQRQVLESPPLAPWRGDIMYPFDLEDDAALEQDIRNRADTQYHPVGTCKMGQDEMAVVDERLCVRGVQGLRVADASIMPTLIGGNTNAPAIMIGEKAADMVRQDSAR